MWSNYIIL